MARRVGATVIGTGSPAAADVARGLGAHEFIDLTDGKDLRRFGRPDVVFDTIGGDALARSTSAVAPGGRLISIVAPPPAIDHASDIVFVVEPDRVQLAQIAELVDRGDLTPHIAAEFALGDGQEAFRSKQRGLYGKVVLVP